MLVRDLGEAWQIVLQPDHGLAAGQIAAAWDYGETLSPELRAALILAAARHDDGWGVWERHPQVDAQGHPEGFLTAGRNPLLLSSYTASADVACLESPLAGLLVSMHVSGLQRGRYGVTGQPEVALEDLDAETAAFVRREEARQRRVAGELGVADLEWPYRLLQVFDLLSLHLGLDAGEVLTVPAAPPGVVPPGAPDGARRALQVSPTGHPWQLALDPYPFAADGPVAVTLIRRVLAGRSWGGHEELRAAFADAEPEMVGIELVGATA